jgi:hypothetical protein
MRRRKIKERFDRYILPMSLQNFVVDVVQLKAEMELDQNYVFVFQ